MDPMTAKEIYREFSSANDMVPVFSQPWWLDAVAGKDGWQVAIADESGTISGTMVYLLRSKIGFSLCTQPNFTQFLGPVFYGLDDTSYNTRMSAEKRIIDLLLAKLPPYQIFTQTFSPKITNWLPFYWRGFRQTTRYSYAIEDISNVDAVLAGFAHSKRKDLRKARKILTTHNDFGIDAFYYNHKTALAKQGRKISYSRDDFSRIVEASQREGSGRTYYAQDAEGNIHAGFFVIWDSQSAYFLISTIDPAFRNSGSTSLLLEHVLRDLSPRTRAFDFEGSMMEGVEYSFRQFGGTQRQLFAMTHVPNRALLAALTAIGRI